MAVLASLALPAEAAVDPTALSLEQLMDISIVGASKYSQRQSEVAAAVSVITREEIKAFGWRTLDEALASLPGVHRTYDRQYTYVGFRGYGLPGDYNTRVLLTIDGNRINDPVYDAALVRRDFQLDLDLVERIEYIPGPGGAVYGQNAMFSVVNVITRDGAAVGGTEVAAGYQHPQVLREGRVTWGRRLDNGLDVLLSASGTRARGENRLFEYPGAGPAGETISGVAAGLDGERDHEFYARVGSGPWWASLLHAERRKWDPTGAFFSDPLVPDQFQQDRYTVAQFQYARTFDRGLDLVARLFAGQYRWSGDFVWGGVLQPSGAKGEWWGGEARLVSTAVTDHKLMVGIEAHDNRRLDQWLDDGADGSQSIVVNGSGYRLGVYVQDEWRVTESLSATLGLRADHDSETGTTLSPRIAAIWQASPATNVKALYGRAGRAPNEYERDWGDNLSQVANPGLGPERIDTLELVVDHRVAADLALRASVYRWTMKDVITLGIDPASGLTQYQAGAKVDATGVELSADKTWAWGARLRGSLSYQRVRGAYDEPLPNSPRVLAKALFSVPLPANLRLGSELYYEGSRRTLQGEQTGSHVLANVYLGAEGWTKGLEVGLSIANLFDKRYFHPASDINWQDALEQDGRSVRLRIAYHF